MAKIHLLVLIHGMWGNPNHLAELERIARETHPESTDEGIKLHVLTAHAVRDESTYDGADWGGERVAQEVIDKNASYEQDGDSIVRFSVTGYSLGGLIARYCIGVLQQRGFFDKVEPINFNTFATPHCGLPSYHTLFSSLSRGLGPTLMSRTGDQFYCLDKWSPTGRPLLVVMADPSESSPPHLLNGLLTVRLQGEFSIKRWPNSSTYGYTPTRNVNDLTVPYVTSAIETLDPFVEQDTSGVEITPLEKYPRVIGKYSLPDVPPPKASKPIVLSPRWFKGLKSSKPLLTLPMFLQFRFPLNIVFYSTLPVLVPTFVAMVLIHFAICSRSSRARVKMLENSLGDSQTKRLADILAEVEREMEEAVVDLSDDSDSSSPWHPVKKSRAHPIISPIHIKIANWLNALPIQKELAFFPMVRNTHAIIICRDVKMFEAQREGESVVRHWANALVV